MRWYFALDEGGAEGGLGTMAKLAVLSARAVGGLEPVMLYHGAPGELTAWMQRQHVRVVPTRPSFWDIMERAKAAGSTNPHTIGHWLRVMIPQVEQEHDYVLYTDVDVIFLRRFDWASVKPRVFAAAPEFLPDEWRYLNSGVMVQSVAAMRASWPGFEAQIVDRMNSPACDEYNDQMALNESYGGYWEHLPTLCNHKPYWDFDPRAVLLHYHGPKPAMVEALARRAYANPDATIRFWNGMLDARIDNYIAWSQFLGDHLQGLDFPAALRFAKLASALMAYKRDLPVQERAFPPYGA